MHGVMDGYFINKRNQNNAIFISLKEKKIQYSDKNVKNHNTDYE